jgi:hypothetical protein
LHFKPLALALDRNGTCSFRGLTPRIKGAHFLEILSVIVSALLFGTTFWASLKIFDRYNSKNTLGLAVFIGFVFAFSGPSMLFMLPLVALLYLLVSYYDLGFIKSFAVVGSLFAMNIAVQMLLLELATRMN